MLKQRKIRECSLQILYKIEISNIKIQYFIRHKNPYNINELIKNIFVNFKLPINIIPQTTYLINGVLNNITTIDHIIKTNSVKWKINRLFPIDKNIIRISCYELLFLQNLSINIIINEAIEIAKKFSNHKSVNFINGILDSISDKIRNK